MSEASATAKTVRLQELNDGAIWRVTLATPKANILDMAKNEELRAIFARARDARQLKAVLIEGEGPHFSFGASVEEHLPDRCEAMRPICTLGLSSSSPSFDCETRK